MSRIAALFPLLLLFSLSCADNGEDSSSPPTDTAEHIDTDVSADIAAKVDADAAAEPGATPDAGADADAGAVADADAAADTRASVDADAGTDPDTAADPDTGADPDIGADPDTGADTSADADIHTGADADTTPDTSTGQDTNTSADTDPTDADEDGYPADQDCNDSDPALNPGATEICDGKDNNCNNQIDEGDVCTSACSPASDVHLVAAYSFDEGSGTLAADSSGNGYHATVYGTPAWEAGQCGGSITYDGTDDWVLAPGVLSGLSGTDVTLEAWIYTSAYPWANKVPHILTGGAENNYRLSLSSGATDGRIMWRLEIGGKIESAIYPPSAFPANQWVHLAGTYDGTMMRLFVNSVEVANHVAGGAADAASDLEIGGWKSGKNAFFDGYIDGVQVWDHARFAIEICGDAGGTWVGSDEGGSCAY